MKRKEKNQQSVTTSNVLVPYIQKVLLLLQKSLNSIIQFTWFKQKFQTICPFSASLYIWM